MSETFDRSQLDGKDREQLGEIASALGVKGTSRMRKADLVDAIVGATSGAEASNGATRSTPRKVRSTGAADDDFASIAEEENALAGGQRTGRRDGPDPPPPADGDRCRRQRERPRPLLERQPHGFVRALRGARRAARPRSIATTTRATPTRATPTPTPTRLRATVRSRVNRRGATTTARRTSAAAAAVGVTVSAVRATVGSAAAAATSGRQPKGVPTAATTTAAN